jgi:hypothetical protein
VAERKLVFSAHGREEALHMAADFDVVEPVGQDSGFVDYEGRADYPFANFATKRGGIGIVEKSSE